MFALNNANNQRQSQISTLHNSFIEFFPYYSLFVFYCCTAPLPWQRLKSNINMSSVRTSGDSVPTLPTSCCCFCGMFTRSPCFPPLLAANSLLFPPPMIRLMLTCHGCGKREGFANLISKLNFYKLIPYPMDNSLSGRRRPARQTPEKDVLCCH